MTRTVARPCVRRAAVSETRTEAARRVARAGLPSTVARTRRSARGTVTVAVARLLQAAGAGLAGGASQTRAGAPPGGVAGPPPAPAEAGAPPPGPGSGAGL